MLTYITRRLIQAIPIMLLLSVFLFGIVRLMPGGPLAQAERNPNVTPEQLAAMRVRLGLDQPLPVQYVKWIKAFVFEGDWGYSIKFRRPVAESTRHLRGCAKSRPSPGRKRGWPTRRSL